jgi:biuret amidohydrolase
LLGNDVTKLRRCIEPCRKVLEQARTTGLLVIHTREGHRPDLKDLHAIKRQRPGGTVVIGELGPCGRILVRGEPGHDIISELAPIANHEPVVDKPGKGAFYATDLECILNANGIKFLLVCGVTTECCVHTTVREANDRGFYCIVVGDCCASYNDEFHKVGLEMIHGQGGLFGSVTEAALLLEALADK